MASVHVRTETTSKGVIARHVTLTAPGVPVHHSESVRLVPTAPICNLIPTLVTRHVHMAQVFQLQPVIVAHLQHLFPIDSISWSRLGLQEHQHRLYTMLDSAVLTKPLVE